MNLVTGIVETLVYAAALDLYRRSNSDRGWRGCGITDREGYAMLDVVDWKARPALLVQGED